MQYHSNAVTNINQRTLVKDSDLSVATLADQLMVTEKTVRKWRRREDVHDVSSRPGTVHYALDDEEQRLILFLRRARLPLDDIWQEVNRYLPHCTRSNTYRTLHRHDLGRLPKNEPETKRFKPYAPGFIHIDWFYLPRLEGGRRYCILAIDRATRWLVVGFYESMSKANSIDFLRRLELELPFTITTILTDNGGCFTNRWYTKSRGGARKTADFTAYCQSLGIEHRLTQFKHPWTNGLAENTVKQIKTNTTQYHHLADYSQAEACIDAYVLYHNYRKRHRALGWRTSYETVCAWYECRRDIFRSDPAVALEPNGNNLVKLTIY
jgi:transposase InsO family protein